MKQGWIPFFAFRNRDPAAYAFFQHGRTVVPLGAVMKESGQLCLIQIISVPHGQGLAGVGDSQCMLKPHGIQFLF